MRFLGDNGRFANGKEKGQDLAKSVAVKTLMNGPLVVPRAQQLIHSSRDSVSRYSGRYRYLDHENGGWKLIVDGPCVSFQVEILEREGYKYLLRMCRTRWVLLPGSFLDGRPGRKCWPLPLSCNKAKPRDGEKRAKGGCGRRPLPGSLVFVIFRRANGDDPVIMYPISAPEHKPSSKFWPPLAPSRRPARDLHRSWSCCLSSWWG